MPKAIILVKFMQCFLSKLLLNLMTQKNFINNFPLVICNLINKYKYMFSTKKRLNSVV